MEKCKIFFCDNPLLKTSPTVDEIYITKLLDGNIENLEIPSTIDGKPVTQIGGLSDPASGGSVLFNLTLKSVSVPETVKRIDERGFRF